MLLNSLVDGIVVLLRKTIYKDYKYESELDEGNGFTHAVGIILNTIEELLNGTIWKNHPHKKDFVHQMALSYASFKENAAIIGRSLSYGLILFSIGLCLTLIYLLIYTMS